MTSTKTSIVISVLCALLLNSTAGNAAPIDEAANQRAKQLYDALATQHVPIDIANFYAAYKSNKLAADHQFLGHWNMFVGIVSSVSRDQDGKAYISLAADSYGAANIKAYPSPKQLRRAADGVLRYELTDSSLLTLSRRETLSLQCKGDENEYSRPILSECLFWDYAQLVSMMKSR